MNPTPSVELLDAIVAASGGTRRPGQRTMAEAVGRSLGHARHLVVEAPTGTGKTYALAAAAATWLATQAAQERDARVVVATATRALQDQLVDEDLPRVHAVADDIGAGFTWAVVKGRSNYLCLAAVDHAAASLLTDDRTVADQLTDAAAAGGSGERNDLPDVDDEVWRRLSSTGDECPGARSCSRGEACWAEHARRRAQSADMVVVNQALYAAHLLAGGGVLPPHQAVIVDEAHALAEVLGSAASVALTPGRLRALERRTRVWASPDDGRRLLDAADGLAVVVTDHDGEIDPTDGDLAVHLADARAAVGGMVRLLGELVGDRNGVDAGGSGAGPASGADEVARAAASAGSVADELAVLSGGAGDTRVVWCEAGAVRSAPIEVATLGAEHLWPERTVVCTSGTLRSADPSGVPTFAPFLAAIGAPAGMEAIAVPSPFDHARQGMLYVPKGRIPSPKQLGWSDGVVDELWSLAVAAGGRTLALFTSRAATERAAEGLRDRVASAADDAHGADLDILTQWDGSRDRLVGALRRRRRVVLCATRSFWTGIDIPGDACVVVAIDRLPFARPDDPVARARRRRAEDRGDDPFLTIDVPAAATQLAQGVGRLIRSPDDRGVVAVLDTRLATARWRSQILGALPPLKRSIDPAEVAAFLAET